MVLIIMMEKICYVQNHQSKYSLYVVGICLITNEVMVYRLKKMNIVLHYDAYTTLPLPVILTQYIHTCNFTFEQGNACSAH